MKRISFHRPAWLRVAAAGLFAALSAPTCLMVAQSVTWSAPASGFVFDAEAGAIRPISGFVGSAVAGPPVLSGIQWAAVAPNQISALVSRNSTLLWIPSLYSPAQSQSLGSIAGAEQALWATDSSRAVILTEDELIWLTPSNLSVGISSLSVGGTVTSKPGSRASRPRRLSFWSLLAADSAADRVLLAGTTAGSEAWIASSTTPPVSIPFSGRPVAAAFMSTGTSVFIADSTENRVVRVDNPAGPASIAMVMTSPQYFGDPAGILLSPDDTHLFIADRKALVIREFDATTGALLNALETDAATQHLTLFTPGLFVLDPAEASLPFLFLNTTSPPQVTFVPKAASPVARR
jgi:hypothetical protein